MKPTRDIEKIVALLNTNQAVAKCFVNSFYVPGYYWV